jgi:protein-disulfide isomerase
MKTARRGFLQSLLAAPFLPSSRAFPETPRPSPSPPSEAQTDAVLGVVKARYGDKLDATELAAVRVEIGKAAEATDRLRAVKLGNADEPVTVFAARPVMDVAPPRRGGRS